MKDRIMEPYSNDRELPNRPQTVLCFDHLSILLLFGSLGNDHS